jgi:preprotein translocase subunit SecG
MIAILLTAQVILTVIITIIVLFQKSSSIGLGAYNSSNESVFGAKGPSNFLSKATFFFGFLFIANTITLGYIYNKQKTSSVLDEVQKNTVIPTSSESESK